MPSLQRHYLPCGAIRKTPKKLLTTLSLPPAPVTWPPWRSFFAADATSYADSGGIRPGMSQTGTLSGLS